MKNKIISLLLCFTVLCFYIPVIAENTVEAKIGNAEYTSYEQAWREVQLNGGTIEVLSDWVLERSLDVPKNKKIIVNMNGHNIRRNLDAGLSIASGYVFYVDDNAELTLNGGTKTIQHKGSISPAGVWMPDINGTNSIYGGLISGGSNADGGGGIQIKKNSKVTLNYVTVAGNQSFDSKGAGGIRLQDDDSKLVLNNSRVCYNLATMGGGGGIRIEGYNAGVVIKNNSSIDNNKTTRSNSDGGGIQINEGGIVTVDSTSQISYNISARRGGGIYLYEGSLLLEDGSRLIGNVAKMEGGAVYTDEYAYAEISADFIGNRAKDEEGGAIYVNDESGIVVENASFVRNTAKTKGGAIYVDSDDCFSLAGKCELYGNTPNNLYLTDEENLTSAQMTAGARVGIYTEWDATASYYPLETTYNDIAHFISDKPGKKIAGGDGIIYYVEAPEDDDFTVPEKYLVNDIEYELRNGTFTYNSDLGGNLEAKYFYSDGYFAEPSIVYNEHFATMSLNMAVASGISDLGERPYTEEAASESIRKLVENIGYNDLKINYIKPAYYGDNAKPLSTIGYVIANKKVSLNNSDYTIVSATVRSAEYADEWASNVTLGDGNGEAEGFSDAATQVLEAISKYIADNKIDTTNVKFWITGYSRGGATANIVSKRLTDIYGGEKVYGYTFEAPRGGIKSEIKLGETYLNIHNVINKADIVTYVGPEEMGFVRYGHDVYVPGYSVGTPQYEEQKVKMLAQLAKLDPEIKFDDYFHEASIEYFGNTIGIYDSLIVENYITGFSKAEDWIPFFLAQFQMRTLTDEAENSEYNRLSPTWKGFRHYYSDYKWYMQNSQNGVKEIISVGTAPDNYDIALTFEQAVANVMQLFYSLSGERTNALMECFNPDEIMKKIDTANLWMLIVDEWDDLSYNDRNNEIIDLWSAVGIENIKASILSDNEKEILRTALPVILDVLLDFVAEDYDHNDQDCLGTLIHNISNIFLSHFYAVVCSWVRSYDSFYETDYIVIPEAPETDKKPGIYNSGTMIKINSKNNTSYYYTLDGTTPSEKSNLYTDSIVLSVDEENSVKQYTIKAIAVRDGIQSEVSTFTFIVSDEPVVTFEKDFFKIDNLDEEAVFVVAGYCGNKLYDAKIIPLSQNSKITLEDTNLNTSGIEYVKAFLLKDLQTLRPLCVNTEISINKGE